MSSSSSSPATKSSSIGWRRPWDIEAALFGPSPRAVYDLADHAGDRIGFALWFYTFSIFQGRADLYLEDLYVRPDVRGIGAGRALLRRLARRRVAEALSRMDWSVLDWSAPSIAFYDGLCAASHPEWRLGRLSGAALTALATEDEALQRPV